MRERVTKTVSFSDAVIPAGRWCAVALMAALFSAGLPCAGQTPAEQAPPSASMEVLARTRKQVEEYFDRFSDLTCKESVTQLVLNGSGHTIYRENSSYDYQFETSGEKGTLKFNETRVSHSPEFRDPARTLLVTTGFASLLLIAHPMYEASYVFVSGGTETIAGVNYELIQFTPVPGASSPASLRLRGRNYPLPLSGTMWVEPSSGAIVKLVAQVDSSLSDLGLAGLRSEVHYVVHNFRNPEDSMWVADSAVIEVRTPHQHWRNQHHFTEYQKFNVNVHEEIGQNQ